MILIKNKIYLRNINNDKNLGLIVGHILGDGSISKRLQSVFYSNSNLELLNEFIISMENVFGIKPRIWMQKEANYGKTKWDKRIYSLDEQISGRNVGLFYPKRCSELLFAKFGRFALGKEKKITSEIVCSNSEFKKGLIKSFVDDESGIHSRSIRIYQDNKEMLAHFKKMLLEFDIQSNEIRSYIKRNKQRYYFTITGYYNYIKYIQIMGITSSKKLNKVESWIHKIKDNNTYRLKNNETKTAILGFLKKQKKATTIEIITHMKSIFNDFKWDRSTILRHLQDLEKKGDIKKENYDKRKYLWRIN